MARKSVVREPDGFIVNFLYHTIPGRIILKILTKRFVSSICGKYMDSTASKWIIDGFVRKNHISMSDYEDEQYNCFNDFFTRRIKSEKRPVCNKKKAFIAPSDGLLSAYRISDDMVIPVKNSRYSVESMLRNSSLAEEYKNGICLVFRLCVNHYHRYCYVDDGVKGNNIYIPGILHTVRPIAIENTLVFTENCREYTVLETQNFGKIVQIEVGAMLVGRIKNHHQEYHFSKGEEKGMFLYGGSTIILLAKNDRISIPEYVFEATLRDEEIPVRMGERIGTGI